MNIKPAIIFILLSLSLGFVDYPACIEHGRYDGAWHDGAVRSSG